MLSKLELNKFNKEGLVGMVLALMPSESQLKKMSKPDIIDLVKKLQIGDEKESKNPLSEYSDASVSLSLINKGHGSYQNFEKVKMTFSVKGKVLYVKWKLYTPSGYGDNGVGGNFEVVLTNKQISLIEKDGFTKSTMGKICSTQIERLMNEYNCHTTK